MNRRSFLSALAATSLTPILPPQVFASGGIWNPDHCGFILESPPCQMWTLATRAMVNRDIGKLLASVRQHGGEPDTLIMPDAVYAAFVDGDGGTWSGGLIRT